MRKFSNFVSTLEQFELFLFYLLVVGLPLLTTKLVYFYFEMPRLTWLRVLTFLLLGSFLLKGVSLKRVKIFWSALDLLFVLFLSLAAFSIVFSFHPASSFFGSYGRFEGLITFLNYGLLYFLTVQYFKEKDFRELLTIALFTVLFIAALGLRQWFLFPSGSRAFATLGNPNYAAAYFVLVLPLGMSLFVSQKGLLKWLLGVGSFLITLSLLVTFTRAGWLALLFSALLFFWLLRKEISWKNRVMVGLIFLLMVGALGVQGVLMKREGALSLVQRAQEVTEVKGSVLSRLWMWEDTLKIIRDHPGQGVGIDAFAFAIQRYSSRQLVRIEGPGEGVDSLLKDPHNYLLYLAAVGGIPLLTIYLGLISYLFWAGFKSAKKYRKEGQASPKKERPEKARLFLISGLLAAIFGYFVILQMIPSTVDLTSLWWLLAGLLMSQTPQLRVASFPIRGNPKLLNFFILSFTLLFLTFSGFSFLSNYYFQHSFTPDNYRNLLFARKASSLAPYNEFYDLRLAQIYQGLSQVRFERKFYGQALRYAKTAQRKNPRNAYSFYFTGELFTSFGKSSPFLYKEAIKEYQKALSLFPNYPQAHLGLGKIYLETGRFKKAYGELKKAVDLSPNSETYFYLGKAQEKLKSP